MGNVIIEKNEQIVKDTKELTGERVKRGGRECIERVGAVG